MLKKNIGRGGSSKFSTKRPDYEQKKQKEEFQERQEKRKVAFKILLGLLESKIKLSNFKKYFETLFNRPFNILNLQKMFQSKTFGIEVKYL